nr:three component ABC system middle component [Paenibacillus bovis]
MREVNYRNSDYYSNDSFNNEVLGLIAIYYVLKHAHKMSSAKVMLILPLAFHNNIVRYINDSRTDVKSIDQLIIKKPEFFSNFNERFYSLLEISANSTLILAAMNLISIQKDGMIVLKDSDESLLLESTEKKDIGIRAFNIVKASKGIGKLLNQRKENLYLQLRVEI